jgi:zinc protease
MNSFRAFVALLALTALLKSPTAAQTTESPVPQLRVEKHTLSNGLDVLLVEDHRLPRVAVDVWYHVGPMNEEPGRTGFAHLFEHMMFQQSKHVPADGHFKLLEAAGSSDLNGTTSFDRTNYFETVPTHELELALWLESDRMGYLLDKVDAEALRNQQDVVRNERRQSTENRPYGIIEEAVYQTIFPKEHPYHGVVIGSHQDIQAATLGDVRQFFKQYYTPNNASLAIVGDIDKAKTLSLVEKYFATLKRGPDAPPVRATTPPITSERRAVVTDRIELPRVYMAWLTPPIYKAGDAEATLAASILGGGRSSRLYKKLVYEKQIAQDVAAFQESSTLGSVFMVFATARPGHTPEELEREVSAEIESLRSSKPETRELQRAKAGIESRTLLSLESIGGFNGIADRINKYNHHLKNPEYLGEDIRRFRRVTVDDIQQFVAKFLTTNSRVVIHGVAGEPKLGPVVPTPAAAVADNAPPEAVNVDEPWRNNRPSAGRPPALKVPALQTFKLPNGLTVWLDERKGIPVVSASLIVRTGIVSNPSDKPGLASLTVDMLQNGTSTRSALQFADELALIGGAIRARTGIDDSALTFVGTKASIDSGLDLLADAVMNPAFAAEELERERQLRLGRLVRARDDAADIANRTMMLALYGAASPYGYPDLGTENSVRSMTRDDVRSFWSRNIVPSNAALIVSGDITANDLRRSLERTVGRWKGGTAPAPAPVKNGTTTARAIVVNKAGAPQTQMRVVMPAPSRSSADYEPLQIMNMVLGGPFSSRINLNLREEHGYTYGANSRLNMIRDTGWLAVSSGVRTDVTTPALREVFREIGRMAETPVTSDELSLAKERLVGALPSRFTTTEQTVGTFSELYVYDLGTDYYTKFIPKVQGITIANVQEISRKHLLASRPIVILVGDRNRIEGELKALELEPLEIRDAAGNVIPNREQQ